MKNITALLLSVAITISIAACSVSNSEPDFQPRRIGSFMQVSATQANWVGTAQVQALNVANNEAGLPDSVFYGQPNHNSLHLFAGFSDTTIVNVIYIDSTMTPAFYDTTIASSHGTFYINGEFVGGASILRDTYTGFETTLPFSCDSTFTGRAETISVRIEKDNYNSADDVISIYLGVPGIYEAAEALMCQ